MTDITTPHSLADDLKIQPDTAEQLYRAVLDAVAQSVSSADAILKLRAGLDLMITTPEEREYAFFLLGHGFGQWWERAKDME